MMAATTFAVLAISIVFLTVAGGGLFPVTVIAVAITLSAAVCITTVVRACRPCLPATATPSARARPWLEIVLAGILLLVLLTTLPVPPALDPFTGSLRHGQNQAVVSALHEAGEAGIPVPESTPWFSLSRNRAGTLRFFLLLAGAFGAALLSASLPPSWKTAHLYFLALAGTVVGVAGYISQWLIPQGDTIWWFIPVPHSFNPPVGCFLNRNHFGGFVAMLSPVALALTGDAVVRRRWLAAILSLTMTGLMMATVFHSLSRGAMLAMVSGLSVTALIIAFRHRAMWGIILLAMMLAGGAAILAHSPSVRDRLQGIHKPGEISSVQSRVAEWRETLRVWPHYPLLGAGMNALRMVYPQTRQTSVSARLVASENEYVQLLAEGGLIGTGLAIALVLAMRHRIHGEHTALPGVIGLAVTGALTVTGIHCLVDFPAHLPLYALVLGSVGGLILAPPSLPLAACLPAGVGLLGAAVLAWSTPITNLRDMDNQAYLNTAPYKDLHRALVWAPTSSAWLFLGRAMYKEGVNRATRELCGKGEEFITRAAQLDPQNYRLWYELGQTRLALGDNTRAAEAFSRAKALRSWMTPPNIPGGK